MVFVDKEWKNEPDFLEWYFEDIHCLIKRHSLGYLCGYARVNSDHPLYRKEYYNLNVHGGVTFHGNCLQRMDRNLFYFGFDCSHYFDLIPYNESFYFGKNEKAYRNIEYVKNNVDDLAKQLYYHKYMMDEIAYGDD